MKTNNMCVSFAHFESVRYNNQLVVSEICFIKNTEKDCVETKIKYHEREVPREVVCTLESDFGYCAMKERAVLWMNFLETSFVCHGFEADLDFADEGIAKHNIITEDYGISEERAFSLRCEIVTNSAGVRRTKCSEEKKTRRQKNRSEDVGQG